MIDTPVVVIRRYLELLFEPGDVFEVRAPKCRDGKYEPTCSGYFDYASLYKAVIAIVKLDESGNAPGIYVTLNAVSPNLLGRAANRIKQRAKETTCDKDIVRRRRLLIDVDPIRSSGVSATETELAKAIERGREVQAFLATKGWPAPVLTQSGNGCHLLYSIDLPSDDDGLVRAVLQALEERFDDEYVTIDKSVHNASRIVKIIGTMSRKGDDLRGIAEVEDRPHRRSEFIEVPDEMVVVPIELLQALAATASTLSSTRLNQAPNLNGNDKHFDHTPSGIRHWLEEHGVSVKSERRNGNKTLLYLERCPINPEIESSGDSDIAVLVGDDGLLAYCNKHSRGESFTWHDLRRAIDPSYEQPLETDNGVDLSRFRFGLKAITSEPLREPAIVDPGPLPDELLRVPGFISEVMDFCLETAPYPNLVLAFGGALALQAFLAGRKVRDPGDNRTNLYILGLAHSSAGKDSPRKVNTRIVHAIGQAACLGERFASGEGVQDALFVTPNMLFQTDEIDGMLQSINKSKDARHENVMGTLLTMYSSSNSIYPMRRKAGQASPGVIDQPNLVVFGTAIPNHYYEALSERMLTNGLFARMIILESAARGRGQEPRVLDIPKRIIETARWWVDYRPDQGNLQSLHPVPTIVKLTGEALAAIVEARELAEWEYAKAEAKNDAVGTTVWGRVGEQVRKLALIYAASENHLQPSIGVAAAQWASRFVLHQTRRMLFMASSYVAENPFEAECLKFIQKLREAPNHEIPHSILLKRMKLEAKHFQEIAETLIQRGDIEMVKLSRAGTPRRVYRLLG